LPLQLVQSYRAGARFAGEGHFERLAMPVLVAPALGEQAQVHRIRRAQRRDDERIGEGLERCAAGRAGVGLDGHGFRIHFFGELVALGHGGCDRQRQQRGNGERKTMCADHVRHTSR
jgi:hypothetical protein